MTIIHHIFAYPWNLTTLASWQKYPHPQRPDILNVELISKRLDNGSLKLERLITLKYQFPSWVPDTISNSNMYCLETTTVHPETQTMEIHSHNISCQNLITLNETCLYTAETASTTKLTQTVTINAHVTWFRTYLETWFLNEYFNTVHLGRQIMEDTIQRTFRSHT